jgi:hypothetical protein
MPSNSYSVSHIRASIPYSSIVHLRLHPPRLHYHSQTPVDTGLDARASTDRPVRLHGYWLVA